MIEDWLPKRMKLSLRISIEDILIWAFLIVTVSHLASFLSLWESEQLKFVSWFQAAGIDMAMARTSFLFRIYTGRKQKLWALIGLIFFSACSFIFNLYYYTFQGADLLSSLALAAVFPIGVTLLSYLRAIRTVSEQSRAERRSRKKSKERVEQVVEQSGTAQVTLSEEEEQILGLLRDDPRITLAQVAEAIGRSKTTAARRLQSLIDLGYVERNGRQVVVLEPGDGTHGTTS